MASVLLLLVLGSLPLLVLSCLLRPLPPPRNANVWLLGSPSLTDLPPRAPRLLARALCSTTGSTRSPTADTVARLLPRQQIRNVRSRSDRSYWPWQLGCGQWGTNKQRSGWRKLLQRQNSQIRRARLGFSKPGMLQKNAVAQKTNQHAAMVDKVARWSVELDKAKQTMFDLAVELYDAEQAERKARACYQTGFRGHARRNRGVHGSGQVTERMIRSFTPRSCGHGRQSQRLRSSRLLNVCGSLARHRSHAIARVQQLSPSLRYRFLSRLRRLWLLRSSLRPSRKRPTESSSLQIAAVMQRRLPRVVLPKRHRILGKCNQVPVGSFSGKPLDILFNNINDWSRKAAAFFLQRRPQRRSLCGASLGGEQSSQGTGALGTARIPPLHGTCSTYGQWQRHHGVALVPCA